MEDRLSKIVESEPSRLMCYYLEQIVDAGSVPSSTTI
jgi:hypothetical protein